jgi:hypothetical protein
VTGILHISTTPKSRPQCSNLFKTNYESTPLPSENRTISEEFPSKVTLSTVDRQMLLIGLNWSPG